MASKRFARLTRNETTKVTHMSLLESVGHSGGHCDHGSSIGGTITRSLSLREFIK